MDTPPLKHRATTPGRTYNRREAFALQKLARSVMVIGKK